MRFGPGALAAAAFVGPGTVTTATLAGAGHGYALVWTLVFATIAAIVLHEMAAKLGVVGRIGLGAALVEATAGRPTAHALVLGLTIGALLVGNAAYEGGNLAGAGLGVEGALEAAGASAPRIAVTLTIAAAAAALLFFGGYRTIERVLIAMVLVMTAGFAASLAIVRPDFAALARGLVPTLPEGSALVAAGLIGTTIVPYNLFLHAATARDKWAGGAAADLAEARTDAAGAIGLGGLASILILATAAASLFGSGAEIASAADMAGALAPAYGDAAQLLFAGGLFAAGLSSAVTAPLASGYVAAELFGWRADPRGTGFRAVAGAVLIAGVAAATS
ncbi:MAG: divalent metal cation transporter, partial [Pseudomonadota bacterium]